MADATSTTIVLAGGDPASPTLADRLPDQAFVIAADSGLHNAAGLGLYVDLLVGDMDSADLGAITRAEAGGTTVDRHPVAKAQTDLELALSAALERGTDRVVVVGGHGGRLDHHLANAMLLASDRFRSLDVEAFMGPAHIHVVRQHVTLSGVRGELVSLLPVHGAAHGVSTEGLLYPLHDESLHPGTTRGVSNELVGESAQVRVNDGVLLVVQPGGLGTHVRSGLTPDTHDGS